MVNRKLWDSFKYAIEGVFYAFKTQRNIRIHFIAMIILTILMFCYSIESQDICILLICAMIVIVTEMVNTSVEKTIDLYTDQYHPLAKIAKDVAAGAVLIGAIISIIIGIIIFSKYI